MADYGIAFFDSPGTLLYMWSLSVEEHFYLIWPPLLVLLLRSAQPGIPVLMQLGLGQPRCHGLGPDGGRTGYRGAMRYRDDGGPAKPGKGDKPAGSRPPASAGKAIPAPSGMLGVLR